ncbi:MAG: D-alanyl-D-alanine carboxypeptidase/D-alanyl-D-alanine-endopeptidase [Chitinophagaceae bacterium]
MIKATTFFKQLLIINFSLLILTSCSVTKQISKSAKVNVLDAKALQTAHVGISIFDPSTNKYIYNYQGDKYFVPASNIKIPTCYAAMKYLGDSLVAALILEKDSSLLIIPTGDPTLLHPEFKTQPLINLLKKEKRNLYINDDNWQDEVLGSGWSWNDYDQSYMVERSPLPVYGNILEWTQEENENNKPPLFYSIPENNWDVIFSENEKSKTFTVTRDIGRNSYTITQGLEKKRTISIPFVTNRVQSSLELLKDTILREINPIALNKILLKELGNLKRIHSQPTDSLLKPMMHRSDNFFAEQSLLMVSNEVLGVMNDAKIIDTILKTDFKDLPQKPRWVDGSGLSRYNLFTPQDFVAILNKMKNEFGMERIKVILPTGGEGTISSYYKADSGYIYGKTGTLSGVVAFSGFLYTKKGKLLIFSTLVNNHQSSSTEVRRSIEKFIQGVRNKF